MVTNCHQLKMTSPKDNKKYTTDVVTMEQAFRIIQSIPSKKAEPFKQWLAQVGTERIEETIDPELSINRAIKSYRRKGYTEEWINRRIQSIRARKEIESQTGRPVVTSKTAAELGFVMNGLLDSLGNPTNDE